MVERFLECPTCQFRLLERSVDPVDSYNELWRHVYCTHAEGSGAAKRNHAAAIMQRHRRVVG